MLNLSRILFFTITFWCCASYNYPLSFEFFLDNQIAKYVLSFTMFSCYPFSQTHQGTFNIFSLVFGKIPKIVMEFYVGHFVVQYNDTNITLEF